MANPWFDSSRLASWLEPRLGGGAVRVRRVERLLGGLTAETFRLRALVEGGSGPGGRELVLRRDPPAGVRRLSGGVECEYGVMLALQGTGVPVPAVLGLERDPTWLERPFLVEAFVPGTSDRNLFNSPAFAPARPALGEQFIAILARLHTLDLAGLELGSLDHPGEGICPAAREVERWGALLAETRQEPSPLLVEAFLWLKANLPRAPRVSLLHGEYRPGNLIYRGRRLRAVVDWEYSHLGDPVEDLGWAFLRQFRVGDCESGFFAREEFLGRYEAEAGYAVDRAAVTFWEAFANVKVLAMLSDGQDAFRKRLMDAALVDSVPGSNLQAEIVRLITL